MIGAGPAEDDPAQADPSAVRTWPVWVRIILGGLVVLSVAGLIGLGVWQLERREWKLALIERVDQRVHANPVPAPRPMIWAELSQSFDEYLRVQISGHFLNDRETTVQAVTDLGGGYWVMTPLVTNDGLTVLINRGFVPGDRRDRKTRPDGLIEGDVTVTGLLRLSEPGGGFLRSNNPQEDRWYSRDVAAIAEARGLANVAPYFIDADATPNPGGMPVGGLTVISFPNNHLVYALTWFVLAIGLGGGCLLIWVKENSPQTQKSPH